MWFHFRIGQNGIGKIHCSCIGAIITRSKTVYVKYDIVPYQLTLMDVTDLRKKQKNQNAKFPVHWIMRIAIIIDQVALANQGDNGIGSVCLSICVCFPA